MYLLMVNLKNLLPGLPLYHIVTHLAYFRSPVSPLERRAEVWTAARSEPSSFPCSLLELSAQRFYEGLSPTNHCRRCWDDYGECMMESNKGNILRQMKVSK